MGLYKLSNKLLIYLYNRTGYHFYKLDRISEQVKNEKIRDVITSGGNRTNQNRTEFYNYVDAIINQYDTYN